MSNMGIELTKDMKLDMFQKSELFLLIILQTIMQHLIITGNTILDMFYCNLPFLFVTSPILNLTVKDFLSGIK